MEPGRQRAEAWLADMTRAHREADRNAKQAAQEGAGEEIGGQAKLAGHREPGEAQEGSGEARACAHACPAHGWRDIETAPRDGTEVLLCVKLRAGIPGKYLVGHWMPGGFCIEDHPPILRGWYFWNGCMFDLEAEPTHWQPLPEPPEVSRG